MRKDSRGRGNRKKQSTPIGQWVVLILLLSILIGSVGFFIYQHKKQPDRYPSVSSFFATLSLWLTERKQHLNQGIDSVKQLAKNPETATEQIHFDFYTTLPSMQMPASTEGKTATGKEE